MADWYLLAKQGGPLQGEISVGGAKNAVLVIMASLLLRVQVVKKAIGRTGWVR